MAELDVGTHCSAATCKQLDFLPLTCSGCSKVFCKNHINTSSHQCSQVNIQVNHGIYSGPKGYPCQVEGCANRELTPVHCPACDKQFCLSHRHQVDHQCSQMAAPVERMSQTRSHIQEILVSKNTSASKSGGKGRKSRATAAKVALMKIKMSASGDRTIPDSERVYLQVALPVGSVVKAKPMFFSKVWSMGRVIDAMASNVGIQNNNNIALAKKLRLFDPDDGHIYPTDVVLESMMTTDGGILNGSTVILEYVEEGTTQLTSLTSYKL